MSKPVVVNHIIVSGYEEYVKSKYLASDEIHEPQHHCNCNFSREDGRPFCGNCMFEATNTVDGKSYCMASCRNGGDDK